MFSGIQEILVIVLVIVVILLAPRVLPRGKNLTEKPNPSMRSPRQISRPIRLAVVFSAAWLSACTAILQPWRENPTTYVLIGILPLILLWGLIWIKR